MNECLRCMFAEVKLNNYPCNECVHTIINGNYEGSKDHYIKGEGKMKELRDDLTWGEIKGMIPGQHGKILLHRTDGMMIYEAGYIDETDFCYAPESWYKPKVKQWVPKKVSELKAGDVMIFNGRLFSISLVDGDLVENTMVISIWGKEDCLYRHKNEFVTVEVEG